MEDVKKIDQPTLLDMLARCTRDYMRMFKKGNMGREYTICREMIEKIRTEIASRTLIKSDAQ